jgi:hypothetical protein
MNENQKELQEPDNPAYRNLKSYAFWENELVFRETWLENEELCNGWMKLHNVWHKLSHCLKELPDSNSLESKVLFRRFHELFRSLKWHMTTVFSGVYQTALRELHFIFMDICRAWYLDKVFKDKTIEEKEDKINEKKIIRGKELILKLGFLKEERDTFLELYQDFCDNLRSSRRMLSAPLSKIRIGRFYDKDSFHLSRILYIRTCDAVFSLILKAFPEVRKQFFESEEVESILFEFTCSLTLGFVENDAGSANLNENE